ncbi:MAG TPA: hypothetical protein VMU09_00320 [Acidimicrobiales bacterium]|nr:hypothetical protein [Acidimicrobiales bacterium]
MSSAWAMATMASTRVVSLARSSMLLTKLRSIFRAVTGNRLR